MIDTQELPGVAGVDQREAILTNPDNLAVCTVIKLLRTIAVNGFRSVYWVFEMMIGFTCT